MKKWIIGLVVVTVAVMAVFYALLQFSNLRTFQLFGDLVARVETDRPVLALTLDDGPTPEHTEAVLQTLCEKGVKATFFLTGREAAQNPEQVKAIIEAGHELGNHSFSHPRMVLMSPSAVRDELNQTDAALRSAGYQKPLHFRPPYGKKLLTLPWVLSEQNRKTIMWDVEPESWPEIAADASAITAHVLERAKPGSIILLHVMYDNREPTRQALPQIIDGLRAKGFEFTTVSELLAEPGKDS